MTGFSITVSGITQGQPVAERFSYGAPDGKGRVKNGGNINPAISWQGAPANTKSYALIIVDPDVPASFDDANKEGKIIKSDFPRQNFYHWVLVDIPASITSIAQGADSQDVTSGGKPVGKKEYGINGLNSYPGGGYDGPCPPWNDERLHHYHFQIFALDVATLNLSGKFTGPDAEKAMQGHVLAKAEVVGTYTLNEKLLGKAA